MRITVKTACFALAIAWVAGGQQKAAVSLDGAWLGTLTAGGANVRIVFHVETTPSGLKASMDSPDQGATGIPATAALNGAAVSFTVKVAGITYEGKLSAGGAIIEGTFRQGTASIPLVLSRVNDPESLVKRRPQDPVKPYPYKEEEVTYKNAAAGITLAATITIPQGKGPFPAVLLITGSGPQDRDEAIMGHRPFLVLADYLTRKGIAVLRADDRGVAKSGGDFSTATTMDFATDAEAGLAYLKTRPEVNPKKIGIIGHSEGGAIAPLIASRNRDVAFIVMMAGPGVRGDELIVSQVGAGAEAAGVSHEQADQYRAKERTIVKLVETEKDEAVLKQKMREAIGGPPDRADQQMASMLSPWYRAFLVYDPAVALRKVTCPVLALNGTKDTQIPYQDNLAAIRAALQAAGNKHFEIVELPGLNHLFQPAKTGGMEEYATIDQTIAPAVLDRIAAFILKQ